MWRISDWHMTNSLKVERARANITQQELAEILGVSRQTINAVEKGKFNPSTLLALKIARVFNLSVNDIFFLDDNE